MGLDTSDPLMILRLDAENKIGLQQPSPVPLLGGLRTAYPTSSNLQLTVGDTDLTLKACRPK